MQQGSDEDNTSHCHGSQDLSLSSSSNKEMKMEADNGRLPSDPLSIIYKKLDLDDLFAFPCVCKSWRTFSTGFRGHFLASQDPLVIQMTKRNKRACSFFSISDGKTYNTELPKIQGLSYSELSYAAFSCGYLIMASSTNTPLLFNPFTRRMKEIPEPSNPFNILYKCSRAILAFVVDSEDFVIVALSIRTFSLHVYHSRKYRWVRYSTCGYPWNVADVVVLHRTLYAITDTARIGVLSLNSPSLKFLEFNNTPNLISMDFKLVSSDGQLLVVHFPPSKELEVYRIDFSTMEWIKLETLGDSALFLGVDKKCHALSNPSRWGYDGNCVYYIDGQSLIRKASFMTMENEVIRRSSDGVNRPPWSRAKVYFEDWCFRHVREEVDYSLDE